MGDAGRPGWQRVLRRRPRGVLRAWPEGSARPRSSSSTAAANTSVWPSTSAAVWCGDINAMLWNGVSRMPRLSAHRCMKRIEFVVDGAAAAAPSRGGGQNQYSARPPELLHVPRQTVAVDGAAHARGPRGRQRDHVGEVLVAQRELSVARTAAMASALPVSVPPTPLTSTSWPISAQSLGDLRGHAVGGRRHAAADRLADHEEVGLEAPRRGRAAGTDADGVGLVDHQQRAVARVSGAAPRGSPGRA